MIRNDKNRDSEFWLQCFIVNSGRIMGKPFDWDRKENVLILKKPCWMYRFGLFGLNCDCVYQIYIGLTLKYSEIPLEHVIAFLLHSIPRIACCVVELSLIPSQMASDHFNEILAIHRKLKCKIHKPPCQNVSLIIATCILLFYSSSWEKHSLPTFLQVRNAILHVFGHRIYLATFDRTNTTIPSWTTSFLFLGITVSCTLHIWRSTNYLLLSYVGIALF